MEIEETIRNLELACVETLLCLGNICPLYVVFILSCEVRAGGISRSYCLRAAECITSRD